MYSKYRKNLFFVLIALTAIASSAQAGMITTNVETRINHLFESSDVSIHDAREPFPDPGDTGQVIYTTYVSAENLTKLFTPVTYDPVKQFLEYSEWKHILDKLIDLPKITVDYVYKADAQGTLQWQEVGKRTEIHAQYNSYYETRTVAVRNITEPGTALLLATWPFACLVLGRRRFTLPGKMMGSGLHSPVGWARPTLTDRLGAKDGK